MSLYSLCRWQVQVSVYWAWRIPEHLRPTQCSTLLHLMDICFLSCICLWQISQIQTCLSDTTPFNEEQRQPSSGSAWPSCPRNGKAGGGSGGFDTIRTIVCDCCDSFTACMLCRLGPTAKIISVISSLSNSAAGDDEIPESIMK